MPRDPLACSLVEGHRIDYTPNSLLPMQKQPDIPEAILTEEADGVRFLEDRFCCQTVGT